MAQGASIGAAGGAVNAIANNTNVLQGVLKGAVIGGAVAAVSYTVNYYAKYNGNKTRITTANSSVTSEYKYDPTIGSDTMQNDVNNMRNNFKYNDYGVGDETVGKAGSMDGSMNPAAQSL